MTHGAVFATLAATPGPTTPARNAMTLITGSLSLVSSDSIPVNHREQSLQTTASYPTFCFFLTLLSSKVYDTFPELHLRLTNLSRNIALSAPEAGYKSIEIVQALALWGCDRLRDAVVSAK